MAIKIEIVKTVYGINFRNAESKSIIGQIRKEESAPGKYHWYCPFNEGYEPTIHHAIFEMKKELNYRAGLLGETATFENHKK